MKTTRQEITCWNCEEQFSTRLAHPDNNILIAYCPYCSVKCAVDLPEPQTTKTIYRDGSISTIMADSDLPEIMPSREPLESE